MTKPKKRTSTAPPGDPRDRPKAKSTRHNSKYDFPPNYVLDEQGRLVPPDQPQRRGDNMSTGSLASSIAGSRENLTSNGKINKAKKTKPIVVYANYAVTRNSINALTLSTKPLLKILSNSENNPRTQILCQKQEDKVIVITELATKRLAYHTFAEEGQRHGLYLIKHHHRVELNEMKEILEATFSKSDIKPSEPKFLYDNKDYPVYLVAFKDPAMNINVLRHQFKALDGLIVTWETFDNRRRRPMPCRRCKIWGHAASGCGHQYRCIKCTEKHEPGQCARTNRNEGEPKCVNCNGPHVASSPDCEAYKNYMKNNQRRRQAPIHRQRVPIPIPTHQQPNHHTVSYAATVSQASPGGTTSNLNPHSRAFRSYANAVSGSPNEIDSSSSQSRPQNFASAFADFASIPDIARTMELFNEMNGKIRATNDHYARIAILAEYCTPRNGS